MDKLFVRGYKAGHLTVIGEARGDRFAVRCDCGREFECVHSRVSLANTGASYSCLGCRAEQTQVDCACTSCGKPLRRAASIAARATCAKCRAVNLAAAKLSWERRNRKKARGRECVGCGRTDAETLWSGRLSSCSACSRMGFRNGWCPCGSPMLIGTERGPRRCRAECGE